MKIVSFLPRSQDRLTAPRVGLLAPDHRILDLERAWIAAHGGASPAWTRSVLALIEAGETGKAEAEALLKKLNIDCLVESTVVNLLAPIPRPVSMRDGYAFRQHVETARRNRGVPMIEEFDHFPVFYFTNSLAVTGPGDVAVHPAALERLDYELEAAFVTGKAIRNASIQEADAAIYGLMVMNDWSARTLQMEEMKLNLGPAKGKDFATSLGPYLVTLDDADLASRVRPSAHGNHWDLAMKAWVNGALLSSGNVKDMSWTCAQILARVSQGVDVLPGEVIGTGTVGTGCLLELNGSKITNGLWLKPGDEVILEIEGLGRLINRVTTEKEGSTRGH